MGKTKVKYTGNVISQSNDDFDWSLYDNGYEGAGLKANPKIKTNNPKDKVYSYEKYAQDLYNKYSGSIGERVSGKDELKGSVYDINDIRVVSNHEIVVDSDSGTSLFVDLNKEKQYVSSFDNIGVDEFVTALKNESFRKELIGSGMRVKVIDKNRCSLWEGRKSYIEDEFVEQLKTQKGKYAYAAKVLEINNGGYIVDVMGVQCFLPGSLAAAGVINDFTELIGKELLVMVVNYLPKTKCWVVSHKKYIEHVMPSKIEKELSVGMQVNCKVSACSKNGFFVTFQDKDGEWLFTGLCHRSVMSDMLSEMLDAKQIVQGDQMLLTITAINVVDDKYRIVLGDKPVEEEKSEEK